MTLERAIKIINKNNMLDGSDFSEALEIVLDTIESLQAENEQLRAQVARMREALEKVEGGVRKWKI
jgi:cell division septum initiation protein DivIVA